MASAKRFREWYDLERPEDQSLPGDLKKLKDLSRLLVIRCLRPDRMTDAMATFVKNAIGAKCGRPPCAHLGPTTTATTATTATTTTNTATTTTATTATTTTNTATPACAGTHRPCARTFCNGGSHTAVRLALDGLMQSSLPVLIERRLCGRMDARTGARALNAPCAGTSTRSRSTLRSRTRTRSRRCRCFSCSRPASIR